MFTDELLMMANDELGKEDVESSPAQKETIRDLILTKLGNLEEDLKTLSELCCKLEMMSDSAFVDVALSRLIRVCEKHISDVFDVADL